MRCIQCTGKHNTNECTLTNGGGEHPALLAKNNQTLKNQNKGNKPNKAAGQTTEFAANLQANSQLKCTTQKGDTIDNINDVEKIRRI